MKNLIEAAIETGNFNTLLSAFKSASLIDMLRSPGQYTIFAPTDAAFKRLPAGSLDALFKDARTLKPFLCNHMMSGVKAANDILPGELKPMEGKSLRASLHGSAVHINGATIVQSDIRATNGVIHAIDDVLVPLNPDPGRGSLRLSGASTQVEAPVSRPSARPAGATFALSRNRLLGSNFVLSATMRS